MKRKLTKSMAAALVLSVALTGCTSKGKEEPTQAPTPTAAQAASNAGTGSAHTGYYVHSVISSSADATAEKAGKVQVDTAIVYVTTDADGKIVKSGFDNAQTAIPFDANGQISADFDLSSSPLTKVEKKEAYGMQKNSGIGKEWYQQAEGFSDWTIGKTISEVSALKTKESNGHNVPDDADLATSVTVDVTDFIAGVKASSGNLLLGDDLTGTYKSGMGIVTSVAKSKSATAEAAGVGQVDTVIAIVTLDSNGKIVELKFDSAQTKVEFNADGTLKTDKATEFKTKQELKEEYGMLKASGIGKEWYQQANALAEWCIGKTIAEVKGIKLQTADGAHPNAPDEADLTSSVTITVTDYLAALEKAVANAK